VSRRLEEAVPALFVVSRAGARLEGWGRLAALSPAGAQLDTLALAAEGETLELAFSVGGVPFRNLRCRLESSAEAPDGYRRLALSVERPEDRRMLREALLPLLSTGRGQS
jgi:hypothetical protein